MRAYRKLAVSRRLVVNLKSGKAIRGVLISAHSDLLEMKDCQLLDPTSAPDPIPLDGSIFIERVDIEFVQAP